MGLSQALDEITGEAKWEAGIRTNGGIQGLGEESEAKGSGGVEKRWRGSRERLQSDGGSQHKGEGGYSGSENEGRWRRPGRKEGRGSETKAATPGEVRRIPNWCEDDAAVALAEGSEEIQAEIEARRKREEVVAREMEEIAGEGPLRCALETLEGKKDAERKRREIREEEEEKREWERE